MGWSSNRPTDYFAVGVQSAKDTEATTFRFPKHLTGSGFEFVPDVTSEREGGGGQEVGLRYKKLIKADGALQANVRGVGALYAVIDGNLGLTATALNVSTDADVPSPACLKMRMVNAATLPYLTVEQRFADEVERVTNAKVNQLELSGEAGMPIKITAAYVGAGTVYQRDIASALTTAYDTGDPCFYPRGSYVLNVSNGQASGAKLTKFKVTNQRHLDEAIQTTDIYRDDLVELNMDTNFDGTLKYEDRSLYQAAQFGGGSFVPIQLASMTFAGYSPNGVTPITATTYRAIKVALNNLQVISAKVNKLEPDGKTVYVDVAAQSIKPIGATDSLVVDLIVASSAYGNFP